MSQYKPSKPSVYMWTDGGQDGGNPGNGAGVAVFVSDTKVRVIGEPLGYCTNNFAEASAVSVGLSVLSVPCFIHLFTDSEYVEKGIKRLKRGSMLETNVAAWERLKDLIHKGHNIRHVEHTDGHADDNVNNLADAWASWCAEFQKGVDKSYGSLEQALRDAPRMNPKKKKNIERSKANKQRSRQYWRA